MHFQQSYRHGMCFRASSVFVVSILFWFPQRTHYFWRVFRFLFMEHKQYESSLWFFVSSSLFFNFYSVELLMKHSMILIKGVRSSMQNYVKYDSTKKWRRTQVLAQGKQFLFFIRHPNKESHTLVINYIHVYPIYLLMEDTYWDELNSDFKYIEIARKGSNITIHILT
jgi:hypothetical protein